MIGTIDVEVNAAHPNLPLCEFAAFVGSPSHVRVRNVPRGVGNWQLTAVYISANYPDNTSQTATLTHVGALWTGTIPGSAAAGRSVNGYQITADGLDESGNVITGYVLGAGDVMILDRDASIVIGDTTYYLHLLDAVPTTPHIGDVATVDGSLKLYNGTAWVSFAAGASIEIVAPSTDPADEGKAADAKATGDALAGKQPTIADLANIRSGAAAGATAVQPAALADYATKDELSYKANASDLANYATLTDLAGKADASALRYDLGAAITASAQLADRCINRVAPAADNTNPIALTFPAAQTNKARDFLALVTNTTGNTGSISFTTPTGATIYGDGFSSAIAEGETWLYSITEVAANTFFTKAVKMEVPNA